MQSDKEVVTPSVKETPQQKRERLRQALRSKISSHKYNRQRLNDENTETDDSGKVVGRRTKQVRK
jgi:hypothetical protein